MRILHSSDWHLGKKLDQFSLREAQEQFLDNLIKDVLKKEKPDLLVISGDIYDRPIAQTEHIELFEEVLSRISDLGIQTLITSGNHDSRIRLGTNTRFMGSKGLHFRTRLTQIADPVVIEDENFTLLAYGIPYIEPDADTGTDPGKWDVKASQEEVLKEAMRFVNEDVANRSKQSKKPIKTLVASHAFIVGGIKSDSERNTKVGTLGEAPSSVFEGIDYVAMGHLHGAKHEIKAPGKTMLRYSGSPIAFSFSERDHLKQMLMIQMTESDLTEKSISSIEIPPWRKMQQFEGTFEELKSDKFSATKDWVKVVLTDEKIPMDIDQTLRRKFPHLVEIDFKKLHTVTNSVDGTSAALNKLAPNDVTRRFVTYVTGKEPASAITKAIDECCDELIQKSVAVNK